MMSGERMRGDAPGDVTTEGGARKGTTEPREGYNSTGERDYTMTVRSERLQDGKPVERQRALTLNKIAAVVAWFVGCFTTWLFVNKAMEGRAWFLAAVLAFVAQALLTLAERPLFQLIWGRRGGRFTTLSILSVGVDMLLNAAGVYPFIGQMAKTDLGAMLVEVFHVQPTVDPISAFVIAVVLGAIVAGLPEGLWEG